MSSTTHSINRFGSGRICHCGIEAPLKTSWSDSNPGRRYFNCINFGKSNACSFFEWMDPVMDGRAKSVILGLLRKLDRIENECSRVKRELERERCCDADFKEDRELVIDIERNKGRHCSKWIGIVVSVMVALFMLCFMG